MIVRAVAATSLLLAGCAKADPAMEKAVLDDMPVARATAATAYFQDCAGRDDKGRPLCHACFTSLHVMADGKIDIWSDNNEYTIKDAATHPDVLIEDPKGGMHATHIAAADGAKERDKGAASYQAYLAGLFETANRWCAGFGGARHDLKNVIADAARGKYVVAP